MITISPDVYNPYIETLAINNVPNSLYKEYKKWLRFYLDFCDKYHFSQQDQDSLPHFIRKLKSKNQDDYQTDQAVKAVNLYFKILTFEDIN